MYVTFRHFLFKSRLIKMMNKVTQIIASLVNTPTPWD